MTVLAAEQTSSAGPLGLLLILALVAATVLLIRSMNGRLRKLPPSFEDRPAAPAAPAAPATPAAPAPTTPVTPPTAQGDQPSS